MAKELPLGIRLNNPGNIEWGSPWEGLVPREQSRYHATGSRQQRRFCEFKDAAYGIRAICRTLITYADKRLAENGTAIDTVREIVARWAPSFENDVGAYAAHVAKVVGVSADTRINLKDYATMRAVVVGIIAHENAGYSYPAAVVDEGLRRAGMVSKAASRSLPVNVETGSAVATGAVALAQLGPVLPDVAAAISEQQDHLTSGQWSRVVIGGVLVVLSVAIAWSQYQKRAAGAAA